jgi:cytochrome d ubiquinol oxidase subunit I
MLDDPILLARLQFAFTVAYHYLFPPLSIGLGVLLVVMEGAYLRTGKRHYHDMTRYWTRIFGLIFALGVASGIVMEFQFGTNWAAYSRFVGDIFGSALAAEAIFAFFLESSFLGILLFGWNRVSPRMHFFSTVMVALGAHLSAIWIVVANSWMQTPAGYAIIETAGRRRAEITSFWEMVFNPSSVERIMHVYGGCWMAGASLVLAVSAWHLLRNRHIQIARAGIRMGLGLFAFAAFFQLATGHASAIGVSRNQPIKLAAFEGHFEKEAPATLWLFGWADEKEARVRWGVGLPGMLSLLVTGDPSAPLPGLASVPPEDRPPVQIVFQAYHAMVGLGMAMIGLSLVGLFLWWRGRLFRHRWLLWLFVLSVLGPQIANQLGWLAAEVGRQPWIVQGILRTSDAVSPHVSAGAILGSLAMFGVIYALLTLLFLGILARKIAEGPEESA